MRNEHKIDYLQNTFKLFHKYLLNLKVVMEILRINFFHLFLINKNIIF